MLLPNCDASACRGSARQVCECLGAVEEERAMALLPAVVPQLVEKRSELVPARLARKVAALFGVPSDENPYGPLTWVCDFTAITVTEIARGAPLPTRAAAAQLRDHG